jgi:hypothetical protein
MLLNLICFELATFRPNCYTDPVSASSLTFKSDLTELLVKKGRVQFGMLGLRLAVCFDAERQAKFELLAGPHRTFSRFNC